MSIKDKVLELLRTKCFWDEFDMRHIENIEVILTYDPKHIEGGIKND